MVNRGKDVGTGLRLNKRARKLAEALSARIELPPAEVERLAAAEEAFERGQKQAQARLGKGFRRMAENRAARNATRGSRRPANP